MFKKKFLSIPIAILVSANAALAGIPQSEQKWAQVNDNWAVDT